MTKEEKVAKLKVVIGELFIKYLLQRKISFLRLIHLALYPEKYREVWEDMASAILAPRNGGRESF